jgi:uncharacterized protein (DUF952 family)
MLTQDALIHATTRDIWDKQASSGSYVPPGFNSEGFIHCCHPAQADGVLNRYFSEAEAVTLVIIDVARVVPEIKYERSPSTGEDFPHIYGPLDPATVIETIDIKREGPTWNVPTDL